MGRYGPNRRGPWCSQRSGEINMFQVKKWIQMIQIMERLCYSSSWHVFQSWKLRAESLPQDFWQGKTIVWQWSQAACHFACFCLFASQNFQADQERPKFPPWTEKGHSDHAMQYDSIVFRVGLMTCHVNHMCVIYIYTLSYKGQIWSDHMLQIVRLLCRYMAEWQIWYVILFVATFSIYDALIHAFDSVLDTLTEYNIIYVSNSFNPGQPLLPHYLVEPDPTPQVMMSAMNAKVCLGVCRSVNM